MYGVGVCGVADAFAHTFFFSPFVALPLTFLAGVSSLYFVNMRLFKRLAFCSWC